MSRAAVTLWGNRIGAVDWDEGRGIGVFQYDSDFARSGIEVSPFMMPLREEPYEFPSLRRESFIGLPGLLADSLPDRFGNRLIDEWIAETARDAGDFNPVDRLCYVGKRGMGALEFEPEIHGSIESRSLEIDQLTVLVNRVMNEREGLGGRLHGREDRRALEDILNTGTSAGGARAKAVLAWNRKTGEFRSGQVDADDGHEHWILKFDGISNNRDRELADPQGFGRIEHAYWLMAKDADIEMSECRLHQEGGRSHFMTRRFDRSERGIKIHMQSLAALRHFDFNDPISYSYEQAADIILGLDLGMDSVEEQFRRAVFNAVARNQDDHVKNISFLMDGSGAWRLSPAYDVTFAYNSRGPWTGNHQMSMAGKRNDFTWEDIMTFASNIGVKAGRARRAIEGVAESVERWREHAEGAGIDGQDAERLEKMFRKDLYLSGVRATGKRKNRDK